jgi:alkylation response protein AidB-like acyl-CoA dehydrogenase
MAENFYLDNSDLHFHLSHQAIEEVVRMREVDFTEADEFPEAPESHADALDSYARVLEMVGEICAENIAPRARDVDVQGAEFRGGEVRYAAGTRQNLEDMAKAELMGVTLPRTYGGLNMPLTVYTLMNEMVSRADASFQNLFGLQDIAETIQRFGNDDLRARYLPRFASGEADGAMALTEPEAGSDLQAVQMKARLDPETGQWYLNGMKRFITNGCAKVLLVLARSEEGIHGSPTCELQFNDVPADLVGSRRRGLTRYVMSLMNGARVAISSQAVGIAEAAYRSALDYARAREQFGHTIDKFPAVYEMLVRAKVQIAAARTLLYETTKYVDLRDVYEHLVEHGDPEQVTGDVRKQAKTYSRIAATLTPLSKAFSTEMANEVAYEGLQVHGGTGYMKDFNVERYCRDARITNIYEGTTQLQNVAAIGGVTQRTLEPLVDELSRQPYEGKLRRLASMVDAAREKLNRAVRFVADRRDSEYQDLMTRRLCHMETVVFVSYLMLRDALEDKAREILTEQYILDMIPTVGVEYDVVTSGDVTLIDRHEEILAL